MEKKTVALVTGASGRLGRAICMSLAGECQAVGIHYHSNKKAAEVTAEQISKLGVDPVLLKADIRDNDQVSCMIENLLDKAGSVDILVNNAGFRKDSLLAMMPTDAWDEVLDINLKGAFYCCKAVARKMISQRYGRIINISSASGVFGTAGQTNYSAAKGGLISFTRSLARELGPYGILVNAIAPGLIETEMLEGLTDEQRDRILDRIILKRAGTPKEVAEVVRFLCTSGADFITGAVIPVDGGLL